MSPIASLSAVVLPEPLGPSRTVGAPAWMSRSTPDRMRTDPARNETLSKTMSGRGAAGSSAAARASSRLASMALRPQAHAPRQRIDDKDDGDQHQAEADGERQISLRGLQRNRRGHDPREAVDVAADDHDGADFGSGAAEAGEQDGHERRARIPQERRRAAERSNLHDRELVAVFGPQILDRLPGQRGNDGRDEDRLSDDHRGRREQEPEGAERTRARQ